MNHELSSLLDDFVLESRERIARVESTLLGLGDETRAAPGEALVAVRRQLHTLKGNAAMMGLERLRDLAHRLEDEVERLDPVAPEIEALLAGVDELKDELRRGAAEPERSEVQPAAPGDGSTRVSMARLDELLDLVRELVVTRNRLATTLAAGLRRARTSRADLAGWIETDEAWRSLARLLDTVQNRLAALRMMPLDPLFERARRGVHDEARRTGKRVRLVTDGGQTPIDTALVEVTEDALGHLVRNAVAHGIEAPARRRERGKPEIGTVLLEASLRADRVLIEVVDDGAGVDDEAVRAAAAAAGVESTGTDDVQTLLFHPGLSTRGEVDLSAGRGVGLAAVRQAVHRVGGAIEVTTAPGVGSRFRLQLPLTVAQTRVLTVGVGDQQFALPVAAVSETLRLAADRLATCLAAGELERSGESVPLIPVAGALGIEAAAASRTATSVVVVETEGGPRALVVDRLGDLQDIVVNRLEETLSAPAAISGSAILGDGRVIFVLDPFSLAAGDAGRRVA